MANEKRLISAGELAERVWGIGIYFVGLRNGKTLVKEAMEKYRDAVLRTICEAPAVDAVEVVQSRVGDTIFEVDPEHGVVKHEVYEVCVVYKTTATDDNGMVWDDFYTSDDIDTAYKTRQEAEANFCSYGERKDNG